MHRSIKIVIKMFLIAKSLKRKVMSCCLMLKEYKEMFWCFLMLNKSFNLICFALSSHTGVLYSWYINLRFFWINSLFLIVLLRILFTFDTNLHFTILYKIILSKIFSSICSITSLFYPKAIRKQKLYCE